MALTIRIDTSTPENLEYWKFVQETARKVEAWPCWMRLERRCGKCNYCHVDRDAIPTLFDLEKEPG